MYCTRQIFSIIYKTTYLPRFKHIMTSPSTHSPSHRLPHLINEVFSSDQCCVINTIAAVKYNTTTPLVTLSAPIYLTRNKCVNISEFKVGEIQTTKRTSLNGTIEYHTKTNPFRSSSPPSQTVGRKGESLEEQESNWREYTLRSVGT